MKSLVLHAHRPHWPNVSHKILVINSAHKRAIKGVFRYLVYYSYWPRAAAIHIFPEAAFFFEHTRTSYQPVIYMDSGFSFDAEPFGRGDLALAVGGGNVRRKGRCIYSSIRTFSMLATRHIVSRFSC